MGKYLLLGIVSIISMLLSPLATVPYAEATFSGCVDYTMDFKEFSHGDLEAQIDTVFSPLGISVTVNAFKGGSGEGFDKPQIFDTSQTNTADSDLESFAALNALNPNYKNVLIIPENNGVYPPAQPDDAARGGEIILDFLWKRNVDDLVFVDADRNSVKSITAFDGAGGIIKTVNIPNMGDGSVQVISVNAIGVKKLVISYVDSGAVGPIELPCYEDLNPGPNPDCSNSTSSAITLSVTSVDMLGDQITGLYTQIDCGGDVFLEGFTNLLASLNSGEVYRICANDYDIFIFSSWNDGSTNRCLVITLTEDTSLFATYDTGRPAPDPNSTNVSLIVKSVDERGNEIEGLWTVITTYGVFLENGFTLKDYTADSGVLHTVCMGDFENFVFIQWESGSTDRCITVTPFGDTSLIGIFQV